MLQQNRDRAKSILRHILRAAIPLVYCLAFSRAPLFGQAATGPIDIGFPPNAVFHGSDLDFVNLDNGNLHIEIPLWSTNGRGMPVGYRLVYDSKGFTRSDYCAKDGSCSSAIDTAPGSHMIMVLIGPFAYTLQTKGVFQKCGTQLNSPRVAVYSSSLIAPDGANHPLVPSQYYTDSSVSCTWWPLSPNLYANDGTGFVVGPGPGRPVRSKDGRIVIGVVTDTNGNQLNPGNGSTVPATDTLGRTIPADGSYYDSSGNHQLVQITNTTVTLNTSLCQFAAYFPCQEYSTGNVIWTVPQKITFPNGQTFTITYVPNDYGEIASVTLPTGGQISWTYGGLDSGGRWVASRTVTTGGNSYTWNYGTTLNGHTVTDPNGNEIDKICATSGTGGCLSRQMKYYAGSATSGQLLKTLTTDFTNKTCDHGNNCQFLPIRETTTWNQTNQVTKTETDWDFTTISSTNEPMSWGNPIEQREYDYGVGSPGALLRKTDYTYLHQANTSYLNVNIADRVTSKVIYAGTSTTPSAQTTFAYDGSSLTPTSGAPNHDYTNFSTTNTVRGNLTLTSRWLNTNSTWLNTNNTYNDLGDLLSTKDPLNNSTTFSFADNFTDGVNRNAQAFVTQTTYPTTNGVAHIERNQFYWSTGLSAASCGQNFPSASVCTNSAATPQPDYTSFTYDLMNRPLNITRGDGGQTNFSYNDTVQPVSVSGTQSITASLTLANTIVFDGVGRVMQSQLTSDPQGTTFTDTTYDSLGRVATVSNPYRSLGDATYGVTTHNYDALGRTTKVIPPDGSASSNNVSTSYSGNATTVTDQAGKSRKSVTDGLGRLTQAFEDPGSLNYETDYAYDVLNNLSTVNQKGGSTNSANWRTRTFTHDSLSRLLCASNPENSSAACPATATSSYTTGTTGYAYDANGNMVTKTALAPNQTGTTTVITSYSYDALNRLTQKSYSDSGFTPTLRYAYDAVTITGCATTPPTLTDSYPKGRRTAMCDGAGAESWSHDVVGRMLTDSRTTNGVTKATSYALNLDGSVASFTYPSGRIITYTPNAAGRTVSAIDSTGPINYATGALYAPTGALSSLTNGSSLVSTLYYNNRLQPCRISVKNTGSAPATCTDATTGNVLDFAYCFNSNMSDADRAAHNCAASATLNNGNVAQIVNKQTTARTQNFKYDSLNRIQSAYTEATTAQYCWDEALGYDPWGNLLTIGRISGYSCSNEELLNSTATTKNQISGDTYDAAGNLITIPSVTTYTYNAENQLTATAGITYAYDGDGKRVQKSSGKLYWFGSGSDPLDETDLAGNTNNTSFNEYVFFNGKRIARRDSTNSVNYYFAEHVGSARIVANSSGTPVDDSDFYPFGGERNYLNSSPQNYKFAGKERDSESGLDNFGARYDSSNFGRFMSPDPVGGRPASPQSWNLYAYVANNPLNAVDPTGLDCIYINNDTGKYEGYNAGDCDNSTEEKANTGYYVDGHVKTITTTTGDSQGLVTGYGGTNDDNTGLISGKFSTPTDTTPIGALPANAVAIFSDINRRNIIGNTFKIYGAGALIGATGGAACYYLCPSGITTLGVAGGTAGLEGGVSELAIEGIQELAELVQTGETQQAEVYIRSLAETPQGQAILRAVEQQLDSSISQMGPEFGSPEALRLFQSLKAMIEPFVRL
jgi:RHS repeat-associated protein